MRKGIWLPALVICVVALASLTTARAYQLSGESAARAQSQAAYVQLHNSLRAAVAGGLAPSRTTAISREAALLRWTSAPGATPLIGDQRTGFYNRQARAYARLRYRLEAVVRLVRSRRNASILHLDTKLEHELVAARSFGLVPSRVVRAVRAIDRGDSKTDTLLYLAATYDLLSIQDRVLERAIAARTAALDGIVRSGGHTVAGISHLANSASSSRDAHLSLLRLFTSRATVDGDSVARGLARVQRAKSPLEAALAYIDVQKSLRRIDKDFDAMVPQKVILVSTESQSVQLYQSGTAVYSSPVTTGGPDLPTDHGVFHIYFKASPFVFHSPWGPDSPYYYAPTPVQYWMPFDGGQGLHDASWRNNFGPESNTAPTDLGGGRSILGTHGCVNLPNDAAALIWNWAPVGTTVVVV